ncbi:hypothetical protein [Rhodococcus marinonascens]|uniref:hypothetical protein n=1 Tax=Rhodococcus marinonascens TaxID=38311 RepID=UPI00093269BB|nr:hypothetical protein [Rhodococcus marinonascens]
MVRGQHIQEQQKWGGMPGRSGAQLYFTGVDIVDRLEPNERDVVANTAPERPASDLDGRTVAIHDTVFRVRRRWHSPAQRQKCQIRLGGDERRS